MTRRQRLTHDPFRFGMTAVALAVVGGAGGWVVTTVGASATEASADLAELTEYETWRAVVVASSGLFVASVPLTYGWLMDGRRALGVAKGDGRLIRAWSLYAVAIAAVGGLLKFAAVDVDSPLHEHDWRAISIIVAGLVAVAPAMVGMVSIGLRAHECRLQWAQPSSENVARILELRRSLRRYLAYLGGAIGLAVLATGFLRRAVVAAEHTYAEEVVLLLGAVLTALLALFYVPAFAGIENLARELATKAYPLPDPAGGGDGGPRDGDGGKLSDIVKEREALEKVLGLGGSARANLESVVFVFTPLASGLLSRALGT